jgi:hypothetical protein
VTRVSEHQPEPDAEGERPPAVPEPAAGDVPTAGDAPTGGDAPRPVQVQIRRAPRYRSFVLAGAVIGALAGVITTAVTGDGDARFSPTTVMGYLGAVGLLIGGLLGAGVAVLVERPRR